MDEPDDAPASTTNPAPFVIALVVVLVLAAVSFVFFRDDGDEEGVFPDEVERVDDDTVRATALIGSCGEVTRAQVDYDDESVYVELVTVPVEADGCDEDGFDVTSAQEVIVVIDLPRPIEDRSVVPGFGRFQLPCDSSGRCAEAK